MDFRYASWRYSSRSPVVLRAYPKQGGTSPFLEILGLPKKRPWTYCRANGAEEVEEPTDGLAFLGEPPVELPAELGPVGWQSDVESAGHDQPVEVLDLDELQLVEHFYLGQDRAQRPGTLRAPHAAELGEGDLELEPPPHEAGGTAPGDVVPLQEGHLPPAPRQGEGGGEPAVASADDYHVRLGRAGLLSDERALPASRGRLAGPKCRAGRGRRFDGVRRLHHPRTAPSVRGSVAPM